MTMIDGKPCVSEPELGSAFVATGGWQAPPCDSFLADFAGGGELPEPGEGDIGAMFPNDDPANRGRDSFQMLAAAVERVRERGWRVGNVDVTVIAERPKIGPHRDAIRSALARVLGCDHDEISVKGKTNEGMGFIGRGEGIAVIAVATLEAR